MTTAMRGDRPGVMPGASRIRWEPTEGKKILVVDWGIGGLATFAGLSERLPRVPLHYLSDSGFTPWGKVEPQALAERISTLTAPHLQGGDLLVLACNAASTVSEALRLATEVDEADEIGVVGVVGVIAPGLDLLEREVERGRRCLAVLGGTRTIASGAHRRGLEARVGHGHVSLIELVAQPLSAHVEAGRLDGPELLADLRPLVDALEVAGCEAALLACTHYPALGPVLSRLAPKVTWLDPVADPHAGMITRISERFSGPLQLGRGVLAERSVATTGDPEATRAAALLAFGLTLPEVRRVR